jgi:hypothetical protein
MVRNRSARIFCNETSGLVTIGQANLVSETSCKRIDGVHSKSSDWIFRCDSGRRLLYTGQTAVRKCCDVIWNERLRHPTFRRFPRAAAPGIWDWPSQTSVPRDMKWSARRYYYPLRACGATGICGILPELAVTRRRPDPQLCWRRVAAPIGR